MPRCTFLLWYASMGTELVAAPRTALRRSFERDGFVTLQDVLTAAEVEQMRSSVYNYIESSGPLVRTSWNDGSVERRIGPSGTWDLGGWFIAGYEGEPSLQHILVTIDSKPELHEVLRDFMDGRPYRRIRGRAELYVDRWGGWHMDTVEQLTGGQHQKEGAGLFKGYRIPHATSSWSQLPRREESVPSVRESHQIFSVAVYLQDHTRSDLQDRGLHVIAGTHASQAAHYASTLNQSESQPVRMLQPRLGDVVVFDSRLRHRSQEQRHTSHTSHRALTHDHHTVVAMSYGRDNLFSDAYDRMFAMRTLLINNRSICGGLSALPNTHVGRCCAKFAREDLQHRPPLWCPKFPACNSRAVVDDERGNELRRNVNGGSLRSTMTPLSAATTSSSAQHLRTTLGARPSADGLHQQERHVGDTRSLTRYARSSPWYLGSPAIVLSTTASSELAAYPVANLNANTLNSDGTITGDDLYVSSTTKGSSAYHFASFQVLAGGDSSVGNVAIFNREDQYSNLAGDVQVWLGASAGDMSVATAVMCGTAIDTNVDLAAAKVVACPFDPSKTYVTIQQTNANSAYLSLRAVRIFVTS